MGSIILKIFKTIGHLLVSGVIVTWLVVVVIAHVQRTPMPTEFVVIGWLAWTFCLGIEAWVVVLDIKNFLKDGE